MTPEQVRQLVCVQSARSLNTVNRGITLKDALVPPRTISVIARQVTGGRIKDESLTLWLVGQEHRRDGYQIVLREDGLQFGLAAPGFPHDEFPILVGWYGDLITTFMGM